MNWQQLKQVIAGHIAKDGVFIQLVGGDDSSPPFAYTIGLSPKHGHELIIMGMGLENSGHFLNIFALYMRENELPMHEPMEDFANLPLMFVPCAPDLLGNKVQQAFNYYDTEDIKFVQCVLSDRQGRFWTDPEYDLAYMGPRYPLLFRTHH